VLIAPAVDMTRDLIASQFTPEQTSELAETGVTYLPSDYGAPYPITESLIEDGKSHLMLSKGIAATGPIRILQGANDTEVPPQHALRIFEAITGDDVTLQFIKGGDHRLSAPTYLHIIKDTVLAMAQRADGNAY
jgi:pimeloyl-ACP methyl ester carboxylesterase